MSWRFSLQQPLPQADTGVTVNTVSPGYIATRMVEAIPEEVKQQIISKIPAGRLGKPEKLPPPSPIWRRG